MLIVALIVCFGYVSACGQQAIDTKMPSGSRGKTSKPLATIPFEAGPDPRIFFRARINNSQPVYFILDSGATWSFLDPSQVEALSLKTEGQGRITDAQGDPIELTFVKNVSLEVSGVKLEDQSFAIAPMKVRFIYPVAGIIGAPFFKRFVIAIDYDAYTLSVYEPQSYEYTGSGEVIPLEFQGELPIVRAGLIVGSLPSVEARLSVDSGASWPVQLHRPFVEANKLLTSTQGMFRLGSPAGLGGQQSYFVGRAKSIRLGGYKFENQMLTFSQDAKGFGSTTEKDGLIGTATLNRFRVILDYYRKRMILEPSELFGVTFDYDITGMRITKDGKDFKVRNVYDGSRASKAGLLPGDVIVSLDGRATSEMSIKQLRQMFHQDGRGHLLGINRGKESLEIKLATMKVD